jgi:hypothetical protein
MVKSDILNASVDPPEPEQISFQAVRFDVIVKQGDADAVLAKAGGALVAGMHQLKE